jgi:hypothetical protein
MKFLKALLLFIRMYRDGFFFSENSHRGPDGNRWGFYRFNHREVPAMFDIDYEIYATEENKGYAHIHGDDYRLTFIKNKVTKYVETKTPKNTKAVKTVEIQEMWI